jgi:hypothetical protein
MGMMLGSFGTDTIMKYVEIAYKRYRDNKQQKPKVEKQQEDVKMDEEEEKIET